MTTPELKEKLSAQDKSNLSRETILAWYRAKRHEKLKMLREEIVSLSAEKREELKAKIIENTKKELALHKKELTPVQRQEKAKEFAETLFKFALTRQDLSELAKKYEEQSKHTGAENLYKAWLESKEFSPKKESPRYLAMMHLNKSLVRKEAFLLLGLIEKYWDRDEAMKVYESCWNKDVFSLQPLWKFFTKEKAGSMLGFYYGSRDIRIYKGGFWVDYSITHKYIFSHWKSRTYNTFTITGWWTVDDDEEEVNNIKGDSYAPVKYLGTAKKKLQGGGYGDEYSGEQFLYKSLEHINREFASSADSGVEGEKVKIGKDINDFKKEIDGASSGKAREAILKWFKDQPKNEWVQPSQETLNLLAIMYGEGVGNYMYRYVPEKNKIYILPLKKAKVEDKHFGGYIEIKNESLGRIWHSLDAENTKKLMIEYIGTIDSKAVEREITDRKLREDGSSIDSPAQLKRTAGMVAGLEGIPSTVEYNELEKGYLELIEKKIKAELIGKKVPESKAAEIASLRVKQMREKIKNLIEEDELIKEAIDEDEKVKLEIKVDGNDEIKVSIHESGIRKKLLEAREKAEEAETSISSVEGGTYKKLEEKVEKYFGPAAPFIMWFLEKTFKIKESIGKFISGTGGPFMGAFLSAIGIKSAKETVGSRKMTQDKFNKLLRSDRKSVEIKSKMIFDEDVKLKNLQLTIPEGNGIFLERSMPVYLKGKGKFTAHPEEKKKGWSVFSRLGGGKYQYKDSEIVIEDGVTIPRGTIIPKGAKIKRTN